MSMLGRKLRRDIASLRWQIATIAAVVAAGVALFVAALGCYRSLLDGRARLYAAANFADVFSRLTRATDGVAEELARIDGVASVETRLTFDVPVLSGGAAEPATVRVISLVPDGRRNVSRLLVETGRVPDSGARYEGVVNEAFAKARHLVAGARIRVALNGRSEEIAIVGTVLSAEHLATFKGGEIIPDDAHFGILWLPHDTVASAFRAEGTFNEVALRLAPGAKEGAVIAEVDRVLEPHGGYGAHGRSEHPGHRFVDSELRELEVQATVLPIIFLGVAAFLLNTVLARIVAQERTQIATMRALGVRYGPIARHYLGLAAITASIGCTAGLGLGVAVGTLMTRSYGDFFHFPSLAFALDPQIVAIAFAAGVGAGTLGALASVRRIASLAPAEAMQPPAPATLRAGWLEGVHALELLPAALRLVARNVLARPARTAISVLGVSAAMAVLLVGAFWGDALDALMAHEFRVVRREDAVVAFRDPVKDRSVREIAHVAGVRVAEGVRSVPARVSAGLRTKRVEILGLAGASRLHRLVDKDGRETTLPPDGIVLSRHLARRLQVVRGAPLTVDVLEGSRARQDVTVADVVDELVGQSAYMNLAALERLTGEAPAVSAVLVTMERGSADDVHAALAALPGVASMTAKDWTFRLFDEQMKAIVVFFSLLLTTFGALMVAGVVYNAARILVAERARELATLRVVGFTRADVSEALLCELAIQVIAGLPLGALGGYGLCAFAATIFGPEDMAIPLVVGARTWALAVTVVLASAVVSALLVRRRLDRLDLVSVLKVRE